MARTEIEVNLLFCFDALTKKKKTKQNKTENKITVVNELAWDHGFHMGGKGENIDPVSCLFPHCGARSEVING